MDQPIEHATHVPVHTINTEKIEGLHRLMLEFDKRYDQRFFEADRRYEQRFNMQEEAQKIALRATETAVNVAEKNNEKWRDSANEWRGTMGDREARFVTRDSFEATMSGLLTAVTDIKTKIDRNEGKSAGMDKLWAMIMAIVGALGGAGLVIGLK